jgi:hypothetical protein
LADPEGKIRSIVCIIYNKLIQPEKKDDPNYSVLSKVTGPRKDITKTSFSESDV